ncbi:MAG: RecQ family zinc-binding domain-containing protein [Caldimonas sp.]
MTLRRSALDGSALASLAVAYRDKRDSDRAMLEQMVFYGQTGYCRWKVLLDHFDEDEGFERCGTCDNCERMAAAEADSTAQPEPVPDPLHKPLPSIPGPSFAPGTAVKVPRYGAGVVAAVDMQTVTVTFPNGSTRCFLASFVKGRAR